MKRPGPGAPVVASGGTSQWWQLPQEPEWQLEQLEPPEGLDVPEVANTLILRRAGAPQAGQARSSSRREAGMSSSKSWLQAVQRYS